MSNPVQVTSLSQPRLSPHMRLRHDAVRGQWTIQAPERSFVLDAVAHEIVSQCDGTRNLSQIVDQLCAAFPDAPRAVIEQDAAGLIQGLADKGVMTA